MFVGVGFTAVFVGVGPTGVFVAVGGAEVLVGVTVAVTAPVIVRVPSTHAAVRLFPLISLAVVAPAAGSHGNGIVPEALAVVMNLHVPSTPVRPNGTGPLVRLRPMTVNPILPPCSTTAEVAMFGSRSDAVLHCTWVVELPLKIGVNAADWVDP